MVGTCTLVGWLVVNYIVVLGLPAMGLLAVGFLAIEARDVIPDGTQEAFVLQVTISDVSQTRQRRFAAANRI